MLKIRSKCGKKCLSEKKVNRNIDNNQRNFRGFVGRGALRAYFLSKKLEILDKMA